MSQLDLSKIVFPDVMDIRTAAIFLGMSEMRLRTLARAENSEIKSSKDGSGKWVFTKKDLEAYKATPKMRKAGSGPRGDGKAWMINVSHGNLEKVKAALEPFGIKLEPRYNYEKMKEYRTKRDAALKATKAAKATSASATTQNATIAGTPVAPKK